MVLRIGEVTSQKPYHAIRGVKSEKLERPVGIEPTSFGLEPSTQPLSHGRILQQ